MDIYNCEQPTNQQFRDAIGAAITDFLAQRRVQLNQISPATAPLLDRAELFTSGGKRLRPLFCTWGYLAAGGEEPADDSLIRASASLDLLHVSALMHDDVMDASDYRRGVPAAHRQFEADHQGQSWRGDAEQFGVSGAILLGNLLMAWSAEMFATSGMPAQALAQAEPEMDAVRTEVNTGQYLDVLAQAQDPRHWAHTAAGMTELTAMISRVVTYKTSAYTIRRPLTIGAALAGASPEQMDALTAYAQPLGRAFQYRDDMLGVFGDESLTGKDSGEDLREGKLTLLVAHAFAGASVADAQRLGELFGHPDLDDAGVAELQRIITDSGARAQVEAAIDVEYEAALAALDGAPLTERGLTALKHLAAACVDRTF